MRLRNQIFLLIVLLWCLHSCRTTKEFIQYTAQPTFSDGNEVVADTISFGDTLFLAKNAANQPIYYFQNIHTGVCFDEKCRRLMILVYWNITGRYLGFRLPEGEFLSKTDHEPFTSEEYERLHQLLANPELPFKTVSYDQLMENTDPNNPEVDGISGATSEAVSDIVVKGAAYTTYKLWTIVYGPVRNHIIDLTEQQLTLELIELILNSPEQTDRVWALEHISEKTKLTSSLVEQLTDLLSGADFYLAYSAINAIKADHLHNKYLQEKVFDQYENAAPSIRSLIIKKLMDGTQLSDQVVTASIPLLSRVNGKELGDLLKLYSAHKIFDQEILVEVSKLLDHENAFISNQARVFMEAAERYKQ